jgi:hypothetical protein
LEWAVVQSFSVVEPSVSVWWKQFDGWTMGELQVACYGTDDVDVTSRQLFGNQGTRAKRINYVGAFTGAYNALEERQAFIPESESGDSLSLEEVVRVWSDGTDPLSHVIMMKARIESMMVTIIRLKNTNTIFREEIQSTKKQVADLSNRLRFLKNKKTGATKK